MKYFSFASALCLSALAFLAGCSREKGIAENPLLGKHPVVFLLRENPGDVSAFIDSIQALPGDSVILPPDTIVTTIDDTIWCVGHFGGSASAVATYSWKVSGKPAFNKRKNDDLLAITFDSAGIYQAKFHLIDNLSARDSAGAKQYIRVIDTKPEIEFVRDTAFGRSAGPADFYFFAKDTAGRVPTIRIDYDFDNKFDTTITWTGSDSVTLSIPKKTTVDSLGNQKVIISITDDDGNVDTDTILVHFNRPPVLSLDYPLDASKVSIYERMAFYWHADDSDNPKDLRYTLQVGSVTPLTSKHTRAANLREITWEHIDSKGVLTDPTLKGNLYWRVVANDGLDTVTSPTRKFYLGDPNVKFAKVLGVAKMQGSSRHDGIRLTLISIADGATQITHTNVKYVDKGDFSFPEVLPGCYRLDARDTIGLYYSTSLTDSVCVELGDSLQLDTILLTDKSKPKAFRSSILSTTYTTRTIPISGTFADSGSGVDPTSIKAWLDGTTVTVTQPKTGEWSVNLTNVADSKTNPHWFKLIVKDRAGNLSDTLKLSFYVKATSLNFLVNGAQATVIRAGGTLAADIDALKFSVTVSNAVPAIKTVYFDLKGDGTTEKTITATTGQTVFSLDTTGKTMAIDDAVRIAIVHARSDSAEFLDTVSYRVRDRAKAAVIFTTPGKDTTVTRNDAITLGINAAASEGNTVNKYEWDIDGNHTNGTNGYELNYGTSTAVSFPATTFGTFKLRVRITDTGTNTSADSVTVVVLSQPPTVSANKDRDTVKINGEIPLAAIATDIAPGTIKQFDWKCGTGAYETTTNGSDTLIAPATAGTINCIVRATDNDDEYAYDTVVVLVKQDKPYVKVLTDAKTVTIRDSLALKAQIKDTLGTISSIEWSCGLPGSAGVTNWVTAPKGDTVMFAPSTAADKYYCVVRATDDDNQAVRDTITYTVLLDAPYVKVTQDTIVAAINDSITLDAVVYDGLGTIENIQWSCGADAGTDWTTVPSPQMGHFLPSTNISNYRCIIRVQDDDGTWSSDITYITIDQDIPTVTVSKSTYSARINEPFYVDCSASDKFGLAGYRWSCGAPGVAGVSGWTQIYSGCGMEMTAPSSGTSNYLCVVEVVDKDNQRATDTAKVLVVAPPQAILSTNSTQLVWSGDLEIPESYRFWNPIPNGSSSIIGTPLGKSTMKEYWWQFSHYFPGTWVLGEEDGTINLLTEAVIDNATFSFEEAMRRPPTTGSVKAYLEFHDSVPPADSDPTYLQDFWVRHLAYDTMTITFKREWANVSTTDTIIEAASRTLQAAADNNTPYVAYRASSGLGYVKKRSGSSWVNVVGADFGGGLAVDSIRLVRDVVNGDLYVAYRTTGGKIAVKRSAAGTGAWTLFGGAEITVNSNNPRWIGLAAKNSKVVVAWLGNDKIYYAKSSIAGANWGWNGTVGSTLTLLGTAEDGGTSVGVSGSIAFNTDVNDNTLVVALQYSWTKTPDGNTYPAENHLFVKTITGTNLGTVSENSKISNAATNASIALSTNGYVYVAYNNYADAGARVVRSPVSSLSWTNLTGYGGSSGNVSLHKVGKSVHITVGTDNKPILTYDDDYFAPQVHVWKYSVSSGSGAWNLLGENMLPYFKDPFYAAHDYYLKATSPYLAVAPDGTVYVAMMGMGGNNNGPIVMKHTP